MARSVLRVLRAARHLPHLAALLLLVPFGAAAQPPGQGSSDPVPATFDWHLELANPAVTPWGQAVDTAATRLMRSWTTGREFTSPLVDHLPLLEGVPSPVAHFGYPLGRPGVLHTTGEFYRWYEALAAASPRVNFQYLNETEEGRRFALVQIGTEANLARLDAIRDGYHRLTDPRVTDEAGRDAVIRDLPIIFTVFSGLHSPETGHPEVTAELAYRLAVSDDPLIREIRENAVVFIVPVTDPDGRDRVVEWYRLHEQGVSQDDQTRVAGPPFWGKYVRHDNNRDGLQMTLALSRQVVDLFHEWRYPAALDLHESVPFLYVSTGTGPYNYQIDPITRHEWQWIAHHEVAQLTAYGMPGVWTHNFFDGWNPGYMVFAVNNRNGIGRFYETFGNSIPSTQRRTVGANQTSVEWYRANPPYSEVIWSLRNNINYAQTGVLHSVHLLARNRTEVLTNYWRKNRNAVERGRTEAPHAWVVPAEQVRKADVSHMLRLLQQHGVELHRAEGNGTFGSVAVRGGDILIRADQPYGPFVRNLMEVQDFPEDAPRPYDDVAWTFPLLYNVTVHEVNDPAVLDAAMTEVTEAVSLPGRVRTATRFRESVQWWVVRNEASAHLLEARWALGAAAPVWAVHEELEVDRNEVWGPGSWIIPVEALPREEIDRWAARFGMEVVGVPNRVVDGVRRHRQELPRIALIHTWRNTQDDGSVRYAFDTMGIPYTYLPEDRLKEGGLRERFDVMIFPEQGRNAGGRQIFEGLNPEDGPLPWQPVSGYPSIGQLSTTDDMTGGMGYEGLAALRDFAESGGALLFEGSGSTLPVEFGLVRGVSLRNTGNLFSPGSIVQARKGAASPITWGYDDAFPVFDRFGPYFTVPGNLRDRVAVRYAPTDQLFLSGLVLNRNQLGGHPAVVTVPVGEGAVVLYGVRVLHRNQTRGSFALAWNAILNWDQLGSRGEGAVVVEDGEGG